MDLALVTGSSRGLGAAVCRQLLDRGWTVLGFARGAPAAGLAGERYLHARLDVSDLRALVAFCEGPLLAQIPLGDAARVALVNNAGTLAPMRPLHRSDPQEMLAALALNVVAPAWLSGFVLRHASRAARVRLVHVSSGAATNPYPGWSTYCASKAALAMLGRCLAVELEEVPDLAGRDVRQLAFAPNVVATALQEQIRAADERDFPRRARFIALHEEGRLFPPEAPAAALVDWIERQDVERHAELRFEG